MNGARVPVAARGSALARVPADGVLLLCVLIWGVNVSVMKYGLTHFFGPLAFAASRFAIAAAVFTGFAGVRERSLRVDRRSLRVLVAIGATLLLVNQALFAVALHLASASTISLLFGTLPIFSALFQGGAHGRRHWAAASLSFLGVGLVALGARGGLSGDLGGILLGLVTPLTFALYSVLLSPYVTRYSSTRVNAVVSIACVVPFLAIAAPSLAHEDWGGVSALGWGSLLFAAIPAYALTNGLWLVVVERIGTAKASVFVNLQPFLGALFAVLLLSETLAPVQIAGGAVIGAGIVLARWRRRGAA